MSRAALRLPWAEGPEIVMPSRHRNAARYYGRGREWATPPELFASLDSEFHFTLDPCASDTNAKCARYFTEAENGLTQSWAGEMVFMNPPYGREIPAWTAKAVAEVYEHQPRYEQPTVVGLLPASTDLEWFHRDVLGVGAEIRYLRKRVRFLMDGSRWANAMFSSIVVVWRPRP